MRSSTRCLWSIAFLQASSTDMINAHLSAQTLGLGNRTFHSTWRDQSHKVVRAGEGESCLAPAGSHHFGVGRQLMLLLCLSSYWSGRPRVVLLGAAADCSSLRWGTAVDFEPVSTVSLE